MEIIDCHHQDMRDKSHEDEELKKQQQQPERRRSEEPEEIIKQQQQQPSPTSSPSHEFSFTISLQSSSSSSLATTTTSTSSNNKATTTAAIPADKPSKSSPPSFALDLSPADEIFFHGHLLPLHLLSHLPVSPRSSTNSLDSFTIPIKNPNDHHHQQDQNNTISSEKVRNSTTNRTIIDEYYETRGRSTTISNGRPTKSKSFSLFGLSSKWRKDESTTTTAAAKEKEEMMNKERQKRKLKFDNVSHVLKRYMRMVRPLLSFGNRRNHSSVVRYHHREGFSYSGNLSLRRKPPAELIVGRRGEFSAPASMRTSPTNSGILVASGTLSPSCTSTSDSTMEELQAAIQAAIAHCKNSIAREDKNQMPC